MKYTEWNTPEIIGLNDGDKSKGINIIRQRDNNAGFNKEYQNSQGCYLSSELITATEMKNYYKQAQHKLKSFREKFLKENEDYKINRYGEYIYFKSAKVKLIKYLKKKQ